MDVWWGFENRYNPEPDFSDLRTIESTYRSRIKLDRLVRRRKKKETRLYEIYDRLAALPDATEFVTRDLFVAYRLPESLREEYIRTHKVVGPEAGLVRSYAVIFKSAEELAGPLSVQVRANRGMILPLALVLTDPTIARSMLSIAEVLQVRRQAVTDPSAAAQMAQVFLRRRSKGNEVVIVGELNRSRNECAKTLENFSQSINRYTEPIETIVEGNWIQMFGPNGIRDWSIAMHLTRTKTLRAVYDLIIYMGCDVVRLLFENELSILSAVLIDYGDNISDPAMEWTPCAASDGNPADCLNELRGPDDRVGDVSLTALSVEASIDLIAEGELETIQNIGPVQRPIFELRKNNVISVLGTNGKHYGNAVDFGGNCLLTCAHVLDKVCPGVPNHLSDNGVSRELALLSSGIGCEGVWSVRRPVVGEMCAYLFVENDEVHFTSPVVVLCDDGEFVTTTSNALMSKGRSGCALVSLTDVALLGVFTATYLDLLVSVSISPELRLAIMKLSNGGKLFPMTRATESFPDFGLGAQYSKVCDSFISLDGSVYLNTPFSLLDCNPGLSFSDRIKAIDLNNKPPSDITCRAPLYEDVCIALANHDGMIIRSTPFRYRDIKNFSIEFFNGYVEPGTLVAILACDDCTLVQLAEIDKDSLGLVTHDYDFENIKTTTIFDEDDDTSCLREVYGNSWVDSMRAGFLKFMVQLHGKGYGNELLVTKSVDEKIMGEIMSLTEQQLEYYAVWLTIDFMTSLIGGKLIDRNFRLFCPSKWTDKGLDKKKKYIFLLLRFIITFFGEKSCDCLVLHLQVKYDLEPT